LETSPTDHDASRGERGLGPLLAVRGLTVVNDNALRWLAIGLGKRVVSGGQVATVLTVGTAGFVLPFIVLAWLAGYLADRFSKPTVVRVCKAAEILIAAAAGLAIAWGVASGPSLFGLPAGLWLVLACVVVIGCQAALLTPSLVGSIAETVDERSLARANGGFATVGLAATLVGMAVGNWLADSTPVAATGDGHSLAGAMPAALALVGIAAAGWVASLALAAKPAAAPTARFSFDAVRTTLADLRELFGARELAAAAAGIVFFWAVAAVAQLNVDQLVSEAGGSSQGQVVPFLVALVGGIGVGSLLAGRVSGTGIDLGLVPAGGVAMTTASLLLAFGPRAIFAAEGTSGFAWWHAIASLALLGVGAGLFDVPLEASFQKDSPPARRGAMLAALNLLVFAGMFAATLLYGAARVPFWAAVPPADLALPFLSARGVFGIFAMLALAATAAAIYAAPRASLRMLVASLVYGVWRFRARGIDQIPASGPVVLVANHLSWLDGFLLPMAGPRPVRMVVYGPNIQGSFLRMLADQWRFILFDPKPKSIGTALKAIQRGLAEGDVIGIFCEGGISRTGQILGFKRGLEWLLERVDAPIVPLHIDGLWGSLLSFSEGRYFTKRPKLFFGRGFRRPLTLSFGPALPVGTHPNVARFALQELTAFSVRRRFADEDRRMRDDGVDPVALAATAEAFDGCCLVRRTDRLVSSLASGDPLFLPLGSLAGSLLGIHSRLVAADAGPRAVLEALASEGATLWVATPRVVGEVAAFSSGGLAGSVGPRVLEGVVMPIASVAELPEAERAAKAFHDAFGVEPVVAFAPDGRSLVAMNTPPARTAAAHEATCKPGTLGRVVNGVVAWPTASMRRPLGLSVIEGVAIADDDRRTLVIAATIPRSPSLPVPAAMLLDDPLDVDPDGFLLPRLA
jgi:acyl-[acyl-carrier-protein]-phospholipid O-acyltransferase/long-chain-fatty-acid--[acyl-carrier-protein] ligase